jgi:hypothetical protein
MRPFNPKAGGTIVIANATSATADQALDPDCSQLSLWNSSSTAISFFRITTYPDNTLGTGIAPTVTADMPVGPRERIVITCGRGYKEIRCIASAADGSLYVTQGQGEF